MNQYKKWLELNRTQQKQAEEMALHIGYKPSEFTYLFYGIKGEKVVSIRDNNLLANVFPKQ